MQKKNIIKGFPLLLDNKDRIILGGKCATKILKRIHETLLHARKKHLGYTVKNFFAVSNVKQKIGLLIKTCLAKKDISYKVG